MSAALELVAFPAWVVDRDGRIRGVNQAGIEMFGDLRGKLIWNVVAPEEREPARERLARRLLSPTQADFETRIRDRHGSLHHVDASTTSLVDAEGRVVGVFGLLRATDLEPSPAHDDCNLTPRQRQILGCLVEGWSTRQIADYLGLAPDTVRNHIRLLLRALGVHSRLEAVALAVRQGLVTS